MTAVLVVDDEALVRSGLALILDADPELEVVGAVDGVQALDAARERRPDLVLLEVRLRRTDGLRLLRALHELADPPRVAILTDQDGDDLVEAALRTGATGYLLKNTSPTALRRMVHALALGATVLAPEVARRPRSSWPIEDAARAQVQALDPRGRAVLRLVAQGRTNVEIALTLDITLGTAKEAVSAVLDALGVRNRVLAALVAARAGLVT